MSVMHQVVMRRCDSGVNILCPAAQLLAVPALAALAVGAGAVVASVGSLVLPFYAGYKLHKRLERRRSAKKRRRAREAMWHKLEDMRWRGLYLYLAIFL